jgi:glutaredoxin-related protein
VNKNVGFNAAGHNIFLEDGIEMLNTIEDNLMIGCIQSWSMLQADITPASYWITNPLNFVNRNHAGGSDFYGFWYELKEHPDGPSATSDVCPQGMPLGSF